MSIKLKLTFIHAIMNWNPYTLSLNNTCIEFNAEPGIACIDGNFNSSRAYGLYFRDSLRWFNLILQYEMLHLSLYLGCLHEVYFV